MQNAAPVRLRNRLATPEPPRQSRSVLWLSLALNVALLMWLGYVGQKHESKARDTGEERIFTANVRREIPRKIKLSPWQQLQSTDASIYAANLRAAGCPEKTVRDIVLPLIEEKFAKVELPSSEPTNFWASFSERQAARAARAAQESAVRLQKDQTAEQLLGFAWDLAELKHSYAGEAAGTLGFLDYDRAEKSLCIADRFTKQFSRADNLRRIDRREVTYQQWRQSIGEVLSAAEFEEAELRGLLLINQRCNPNLCNAGLSGSELRQLMTYRRDSSNPLPSALLADGRELVHEVNSVAEQQFNAKARSLLGDNRFIDYLKTCDATIEYTLVTLDKLQSPRTLALQLFDVRQAYVVRAGEIRQLTLRRSEKRVQLAALRQSAIDQIASIVGATADGPLLRYNMDWLQEIKNP
jgi:hypothetical protein